MFVDPACWPDHGLVDCQHRPMPPPTSTASRRASEWRKKLYRVYDGGVDIQAGGMSGICNTMHEWHEEVGFFVY